MVQLRLRLPAEPLSATDSRASPLHQMNLEGAQPTDKTDVVEFVFAGKQAFSPT
jgi:hypothetical protein